MTGLLATALVSSCDVAVAAIEADVLHSLRTQAAEAGDRKALLSPGQRKVDSHIRRYAWPEATPPAVASGLLAIPEMSPWRDGGRLHVIVKVANTGSPTPSVLEAAGLEIEIINDRFGLVQGWIGDGAVSGLADLAVVQSIGPAWPAEHNTGSVTSQGDHDSRADLVRQLGYDGSGVVVGVISDGINSVATSQALGDLPPVVVPLDPRCRTRSGDEGTAMLEIVHDLAPGAGLLFSGPGTILEMVDTINCLTAAGADVIVDDLIFFEEPFFEDGRVAQTAAAAVASGVSYHTAAGNFGDHQYLFENYRPGPNGFHDFDPNGSGETLNLISVPPGGQLSCFLQWADPFGASSNDYDLYAVDPFTDIVVDKSENPQDGSQDPSETVHVVNLGPTFADVGIAILLSAGVPRALKLLCPSPGTSMQFASTQFGISGHAARPEVITVAAINAQTAGLDVVEAFSSNGPAPIFFPSPVTRPKPDLAGFDGVVTTLPLGGEFNPFLGTSAAAPHSAAVAALLLSKNPNLTPAQVQSVLTSTAVDIEAPGFDSSAGYGRLDALAAINAVSVPTTPTTSTSTTIPAADRCVTGGCDDGNPCTDDVCDPVTGCQHAANTASCSDGNQCTLADQCNGGRCQPGPSVTAGTLSTLITAGVNASVADCRNDKRKQVKKVVNPLVQAAKAFSRAEVAGVGTKKWTKQVAKGEQMIGTARSKLTKVEAKLSSACVSQLEDAIRTGALGDTCLR
jgi:subtilisin family serine protease